MAESLRWLERRRVKTVSRLRGGKGPFEPKGTPDDVLVSGVARSVVATFVVL